METVVDYFSIQTKDSCKGISQKMKCCSNDYDQWLWPLWMIKISWLPVIDGRLKFLLVVSNQILFWLPITTNIILKLFWLHSMIVND